MGRRGGREKAGWKRALAFYSDSVSTVLETVAVKHLLDCAAIIGQEI